LKKEKPKLPDSFEEDTWLKLKLCINAVHTETPVGQSFEELYKAVEDLCIHKLGQGLYSRLEDECQRHIEKSIRNLTGQTPDPVLFLELVHMCWNKHSSQMSLIRSIFLYLDRTYVIQAANVSSIWDLGLSLFRRHLEACSEVHGKIREGILKLIALERKGDMVDRGRLRGLVRMLVELGLYAPLEQAVVRETHDFYRVEADACMQTLDVPAYLAHVQRRLDEENERIIHYLDAATRKPLIGGVDEELLSAHVTALLDKGLPSLLEAPPRMRELRLLYALVGRVGGLAHLKAGLGAFVRRAGTALMVNQDKDKDMVQDLLQFKSNLDSVLEQAWGSCEELGNAMKDAFESFINVRQNKPAEYMAKFLDAQLRAGGKGVSEADLELLLDKVMGLFRYMQGKDIFEAFFKKDLAKRLLLGKSSSIDAEKSLIAKLKHECGSSFTNKLEGMFKDMDVSGDLMTAYADSALRPRHLDSDISVQVLTTGYWPAYPPAPLKIPRELLEHLEAFEKFYLSKHQGRRLTWQNSNGNVTMKATFRPNDPTARKELQVSLFQAAVLLLFNTEDEIRYSEVVKAVDMEDKELRRTLQSLACAKHKVLNKSPKGRDVEAGDTFSFNPKFDCKQLRIKVNSIQLKETQEEKDKTTEGVVQDRQYQVDAAVVRVMKARKTLSHQLLISELYKQLKFNVNVNDLKKRIESLIDREYLERDKDNPSLYTYLA